MTSPEIAGTYRRAARRTRLAALAYCVAVVSNVVASVTHDGWARAGYAFAAVLFLAAVLANLAVARSQTAVARLWENR